VKAALFVSLPYGPTREQSTRWPVPNELYDPEQGVQAVASALADVELADELGFDWIGCAEHHYSPGSLAPNVDVVAAAISQRAKRAKVCIMGALIPLNNPVRIAEEYALIDTMTGGRLVAGLLRGAPYEYLVYNVAPAESRSRFEEAFELIEHAWTETQPFGWDGNHYHFSNVSIWPRPVQQPTPPIFISGSSQESGEFAARKRIGLGLAFTNVKLAAPAARFYREKAAEFGWTPAQDQIIYGHLPVQLYQTDQQAFDAARPMVERSGALAGGILAANRLVVEAGFFGQRDQTLTRRFQHMAEEPRHTLEEQIELGTLLCGGPDTVVKQMRHLRDELGVGVLSLNFVGPRREETIQLFAKEVLPAMHDL